MRLDFKKIYVQSTIDANPLWRDRARSITDRFPAAEVVPVESHWMIPELVDRDPAEWMRSKREHLVLGVKSGMTHAKNGRSADFIAASNTNGCLSACQYCYVGRRKGGSNPLTIFVNIEQVADAIRRHQRKLGAKIEPNQCDPKLWTYDIGCNSDPSLDALVCDNPGHLVREFTTMENAKATFATKTVNDDYWLALDPKGKTRIRYSLMPQAVSRYVDIGTSSISERIASINRLVAGGYEVHVNFSPVILYGSDDWRRDWRELWRELDDTLTEEAKRQLKCEVIFLTHSTEMHDVNLRWNPRGEDFLWSPELQQPKRDKPDVLIYDYQLKAAEIKRFTAGIGKYLPYCAVRYAF